MGCATEIGIEIDATTTTTTRSTGQPVLSSEFHQFTLAKEKVSFLLTTLWLHQHAARVVLLATTTTTTNTAVIPVSVNNIIC